MGKINFKNSPFGGFANDPFTKTLISIFSALLAPSKSMASSGLFLGENTMGDLERRDREYGVKLARVREEMLRRMTRD